MIQQKRRVCRNSEKFAKYRLYKKPRNTRYKKNNHDVVPDPKKREVPEVKKPPCIYTVCLQKKE